MLFHNFVAYKTEWSLRHENVLFKQTVCGLFWIYTCFKLQKHVLSFAFASYNNLMVSGHCSCIFKIQFKYGYYKRNRAGIGLNKFNSWIYQKTKVRRKKTLIYHPEIISVGICPFIFINFNFIPLINFFSVIPVIFNRFFFIHKYESNK